MTIETARVRTYLVTGFSVVRRGKFVTKQDRVRCRAFGFVRRYRAPVHRTTFREEFVLPGFDRPPVEIVVHQYVLGQRAVVIVTPRDEHQLFFDAVAGRCFLWPNSRTPRACPVGRSDDRSHRAIRSEQSISRYFDKKKTVTNQRAVVNRFVNISVDSVNYGALGDRVTKNNLYGIYFKVKVRIFAFDDF